MDFFRCHWLSLWWVNVVPFCGCLLPLLLMFKARALQWGFDGDVV
jgi:hypothetical protein